MLGFMRKHASSTVIKVIFWMIIIVFVFWGVGVMVSGGSRVNVAATVNGEPIGVQAYQRAYENMQRLYQQLYRENFSPQLAAQLNLHQRALDDLVTNLLLKREATRLGLQVTDDEVRDAILNVPTFQSGGRFDRARYVATLRASRITPAEFEESQRESLLITKLESLLTDGLYVSDGEVHDRFVLENEKINVVFVNVPYAKFRDAATITDGEVSEYYEKNQEQFRQPERVTLTYVPYAPKAFEAAVPVSDESVATYYETHPGDFETPEKIRIRQILIAVPAGADDAARSELRTEAEAVLAEARAGGDFAALARTHSGDPLSAEAGGDLGFVERGMLETPLEDAAFALEPGQVSDVVESARGFSIVKVDEKQARAVRPLPEVRELIVQVLQERGSDQAARDALTEDLGRARGGERLEDLASTRGLTATTSPPVSRGQPLAGVQGPALVTTALGLDSGAVEEAIGTDPPYYLFKVVEKTPSAITPLEGARAPIIETLRSEKAKEAARAEADAILADARAAGGAAGLAAAAKAKGYPIEETGAFGRSEAIPKLGTVPIKDQFFALRAEAPFGTHAYRFRDGAVAFALKERVPPDEASFADKSAGVRDGALARRRTEVLESYRDMLRQRADISVNPDIVTRART